MKKLFLIPALLILVLLSATPVFADDPPDTEVGIGITTPGNVDIDVDIDAGGDITMNLDGTPYPPAPQAGSPGNGAMSSRDYWRYWTKYIQPIIDQLGVTNSNTNLALDAVAKLIQNDRLTQGQIKELANELDDQQVCMIRQIVDSMELAEAVGEEDSRLQDMIVNGAETHIEMNRLELQSQMGQVTFLQEESNLHKNEIEVLQESILAAENEIDRLNGEVSNLHLYTTRLTVVVGAVFVVVIACLVVLFRRRTA